MTGESSFNPRPREGATVGPECIAACAGRVSIHAPAKGRRPPTGAVGQIASSFQSTPPRRGDLVGQTIEHARIAWFQSTPPRRGDRHGLCRAWRACAVSIHAPAKGRPQDRRANASRVQRVSIHAPAKGRPLGVGLSIVSARGFNPRPREGATAVIESRRDLASTVSIHAPAKGATPSGRRRAVDVTEFQSTPPRRGDAAAAHAGRRADRGFNPRPREGATVDRQQVYHVDTSRFQSTPPRRGDVGAESRRIIPDWFQSTPPRRGDRAQSSDLSEQIYMVSIHAPAKGRPRSSGSCALAGAGFNPRPREGATSCI